MYLIIDALAELRLAIVILYHIQSLVDGLFVLKWEHQPAAQQSATHRTHRLVDDIQQRLSILLHGINQLQTADGELIQSYILIFLDARDRCDMANLGVLSLLKILQNGSSSDDS